MEEKQNKEKVTLDNILDEIRLMRKEARIQHRQALVVVVMSVMTAVWFVGLSFYIVSGKFSWEWWQGLIIMVVSLIIFLYAFSKERKLREEQRELHKETEND